MRKDRNNHESARREENEKHEHRHGSSPRENENQNQNPPRTTSKGWMTTPKFGSSTSGGGELEPGPERD
jgi:hypothetical protein